MTEPRRCARVAREIVCLAFALSGCSTPEGDGNGNETGDCYNVDVCAALPVEQVNAALGGPFAHPVWSSTERGPGSYSDYCAYTKPGTTGLQITRTCSADTFAASQYDGMREGDVQSPNTKTDLTGVGDRAFVFEAPNGSPDRNLATLFAVQGYVFIMIDDYAVRSGQDVREGFAQLAKVLFVQ